MFLLNLIASVAIIANLILAIHGYMGYYQLILLFVALMALLSKEGLGLNDPYKYPQYFRDEEDREDWFASRVDDHWFSVVGCITVGINLVIVLIGLE